MSNTPHKKTRKKTDVDQSASFIAKWREDRIKKQEQRDKAKAKHQRIKEQAYEEALRSKANIDAVNTLSKQNRRRSHPFLLLMLLAIVMGLAGAVVWQYKEQQISLKNDEIGRLKQESVRFEEQKKFIDNAKKAEEASYHTVNALGVGMRLPVSWQKMPSEFPADEVIYGNEVANIKFISNPNRSSSSTYVPSVDYLWQSELTNQSTVSIKSKSMHCENFDTISNDFSVKLREHNGFNVYCDTKGDRVVIAVLSKPAAYGLGESNVYFIVTVNDIQQFNSTEIEALIKGAKVK